MDIWLKKIFLVKKNVKYNERIQIEPKKFKFLFDKTDIQLNLAVSVTYE